MDNTSHSSFTLRRPDVILFTVQVSLVFIVVCTSLANLTLYQRNIELWTMILTGCLGYIMPNPRYKRLKDANKDVHQMTPLAAFEEEDNGGRI